MHICMRTKQSKWCTHWVQEIPKQVYALFWCKPVLYLTWTNSTLWMSKSAFYISKGNPSRTLIEGQYLWLNCVCWKNKMMSKKMTLHFLPRAFFVWGTESFCLRFSFLDISCQKKILGEGIRLCKSTTLQVQSLLALQTGMIFLISSATLRLGSINTKN